MYRLLIVWIGKVLLLVTRFRGGGSALPGLIVERLYPRFLNTYKNRFGLTLLVTGTNGKTTTTKMIRYILQAENKKILTNAAGSNMPRGVISAILSAMDWRGRFHADVGLFEVDEGFVGQLAAIFHPKAILVLNLLRDQLDRYGELDRTARLLAESLPHSETAILNADDSRVADLAESALQTMLFGADTLIKALVPHDDALYRYEHQEADLQPKDTTVHIRSVKQTGTGQTLELSVAGEPLSVKLQISGVFNAYNAAAAITVAHCLRIPTKTVASALAKVTPAFGRSERIQIGNKSLLLLLVKNPGGFNQIINTYLVRDDNNNPVMFAINDNYADGRDVSWLWDVSIEYLENTGKKVLTSGTRGYDMALRLHYADISSITELDQTRAIARFLEAIPDNGTGYIVPTYTAMLSIRKILSTYADLPEAGL